MDAKMFNMPARPIGSLISAGLLAGGILLLPGAAAGSSQPGIAATHVRPARRAALPPSARTYYQNVWGVDILGVKPVSSGTMIRFSYRVVDATKAKTLNDKSLSPLLVDQKTNAALVVPVMEKVGQLRQTSTPENGREYWILFSNKGNFVKAGSRVDVVIGSFRANGLIVEPL
ncbi:MAG: hypothetical protein HY049_11970 [Acidobacteria bacterium]|nr:hypothetical protein [Acidobacteriota bacterium]